MAGGHTAFHPSLEVFCMSRVGCPNGCGICDVCGSNVCAGNCWESTALSEGALDPKVLLAEEEEKSDVDMNVFSALSIGASGLMRLSRREVSKNQRV